MYKEDLALNDKQYFIRYKTKQNLIWLHSSIAIVSIHLNVFNYHYPTLTILCKIYHLFSDSEVVTSIVI